MNRPQIYTLPGDDPQRAAGVSVDFLASEQLIGLIIAEEASKKAPTVAVVGVTGEVEVAMSIAGGMPADRIWRLVVDYLYWNGMQPTKTLQLASTPAVQEAAVARAKRLLS